MGVRGEYIIKYSGLKEGVHNYNYVVDGAFFEHFEYSGFEDSRFEVDIQLDRKRNMLVFDFDIDGTFTVPCDRCGEEVTVPIEGEQRLIVKFGDEEMEGTDEILILPHSEYEIDVSKFIYEFILLLEPKKRVHNEGECNPEVLKRLDEQQSDEQEGETDPRWAALKGIKFDE